MIRVLAVLLLVPGPASAQALRAAFAERVPVTAPVPSFSAPLAAPALGLSAAPALAFSAAPAFAPALAPAATLAPSALPAALAATGALPSALPAAERPSDGAAADPGRAAFDGAAAPRIAVIGAGAAGLAAVHELDKLGLAATAYETEARAGGRVRSTTHARTGLTLDAGAEFVSSTHRALLDLMAELGVKTIRRRSVAKKRTFLVDGKAVDEEKFKRSLFRNAAASLKAIVRDDAVLRSAIVSRDAAVLRRFDSKTLGTYLDEIAAPAPLRAFVKAVVDSESGRDYRTLSSVVLFECLGIDLAKKTIAVLPDEDEVFRVRGGAAGIFAALEARHRDSIAYGHRLTAIDSDDGNSFRLSFETPLGPRVVEADRVIVALPLTALQTVKIRAPGWTPERQAALDRASFGAHLKMTLFFDRREWRRRGHSGGGFTDSGFAFWESSEGQGGRAGSVTFLGRDDALDAKSPGALAWEFLDGLANAFRGLKSRFLGWHLERWPRSYPFADGPGDPYAYGLTYLGRPASGAISAAPLGGLHWAGDFFSARSPAYMNGAVETAQTAARAVARETTPAR